MANAKPLRRLARPLALSLALWCGLSAGCVDLNAFVAPNGKAPATGVPHQIQVTWESRVLWTADTVHNGEQVPVLAGQLFLFGPEIGFPMAGDGAVEVYLYDDGPVAAGGQPVCIEGWGIDDKTLPRLLKKSGMLRPCYTLVVPWFTLREHPGIKMVHLMVKYTPKGRAPLFHQCAPMPIDYGDVPPSFAFNQAPAPQAVRQAAASQPAAQPQPVRPAVYQPPVNPLPVNPPPPIPQGVSQLPNYPPPFVPAQAGNVPPPPVPVTSAAANTPAVPSAETLPRYERIRIGPPRVID